MELGYWLNFIGLFSFGVILVQISHGKMLNSANVNFSLGFLKIIRYMGLFIVIYSCYGLIIDYVIAS